MQTMEASNNLSPTPQRQCTLTRWRQGGGVTMANSKKASCHLQHILTTHYSLYPYNRQDKVARTDSVGTSVVTVGNYMYTVEHVM